MNIQCRCVNGEWHAVIVLNALASLLNITTINVHHSVGSPML